jgi:triosephosphate isomerase
LVIGNWKMNLDFVEALHLTQQLGVLLKNHPVEHTDVVIAPPFVDLRSVGSILDAERLPVALGAQHVNPQENGAHTGEVSVSMLQRLGVEWVIVGHSERRTNYAMSDEIVASTLRAVVRAGLHAVLCVGEALSVREADEHQNFVAAQLRCLRTTLGDRDGRQRHARTSQRDEWPRSRGARGAPHRIPAGALRRFGQRGERGVTGARERSGRILGRRRLAQGGVVLCHPARL